MSLEKTGVVTVPFLGDRSYIQGPTLLAAIMYVVPATASIDFRVRTVIRSDRIKVRSLDQAPTNEKSSAAILECELGVSRFRWGAEPLEPSSHPVRVPFNEEEIWQAARFETTSASATAPFHYDFVTLATSLNKALLIRTVTPRTNGRWIFIATRLKLSPLPQSEVKVVKVQSLQQSTLMRSQLFADGEHVGTLDFVWKQL
jgi:hypothetical protein